MTTGEPRPWGKAFLWMTGCGLLFSGVYNACNWITTLRTDVGVWAFPWEFRIPFVPWMIIPYWSLDLIFVGAFFVCSTRRELKILGKRVVLAILVGGTCFLVLPLRNLFPRPAVEGFSAPSISPIICSRPCTSPFARSSRSTAPGKPGAGCAGRCRSGSASSAYPPC